MAKEQQQRTSAKKVKDKWKAKEWYKVIAPEMFDSKQIAETLADSKEKLIGRIVEATLQDIIGDFSKMHVKLRFQIRDIRGNDAITKFVGHDQTSDYIRRQVRRRKSKLDGVFDVITKDSYKIRIKPMAVTDRKIQNAQLTMIRNAMQNYLTEDGKNKTMSELVKEMLSGDMGTNLFKTCKHVYPIKRVEVRKSEVIEEGVEIKEVKVEEVQTEEGKAEEVKKEELKEEIKEEVQTEKTEEKKE